MIGLTTKRVNQEEKENANVIVFCQKIDVKGAKQRPSKQDSRIIWTRFNCPSMKC